MPLKFMKRQWEKLHTDGLQSTLLKYNELFALIGYEKEQDLVVSR